MEHPAETAKVREWQARMREFVRQTKLPRQGERERVIVTKSKTVSQSGLIENGMDPSLPAIPKPEQEYFDWEIKELREEVTSIPGIVDEDDYGTLVVPINVYQKISTEHQNDLEYLVHLGEVINSWDHIGNSPKDVEKIEFYKELEGVWFTAVVKKDKQLHAYILATFHRIYRRKMEKRIASGYLISR